jgi:hypothetical protein
MTVQYEATELDVEQLMLRIKESAAKRKLAARHSRFQPWARAYSLLRGRSQSHIETEIPDLKLSPDFKPNKDNHYHVSDLLRFHDTHFVKNAYQAILKRDPDDEGFRGYLECLRNGDRNKIDILANLRFSAEGRQRKVRVDGLGLPATVRLIRPASDWSLADSCFNSRTKTFRELLSCAGAGTSRLRQSDGRDNPRAPPPRE